MPSDEDLNRAVSNSSSRSTQDISLIHPDNQCNSTTEGPDSQCQTAVVNSIDGE